MAASFIVSLWSITSWAEPSEALPTSPASVGDFSRVPDPEPAPAAAAPAQAVVPPPSPVAPSSPSADVATTTAAPSVPQPVVAQPVPPPYVAAPAPTPAYRESAPVFARRFPNPDARKDAPSSRGPAVSRENSSSPRVLGAMLDVGLPDGAVAGLAFRPASWVRAQGGVGTNTISPGLRAGLVLLPFGQGPSVTVEGGSYFEGDARSVVEKLAGSDYADSKAAQKVGYQFANFHLGLDFGSKYTTFFIHGGMTYLRTKLHDPNDALGGQSVASDGSVTTFAFKDDLTITAMFPSFKLGFIVYIV